MEKSGGTGSVLRWAELLRLAVWFGLLTAGAELSLRAVQKLSGQQIVLPRQFVWMIPVADLTLFILAAAVLMTFFLWRRGPSFRAVVSLFTLLFMAGPLIAFPRFHPLASTVLALGVAVTCARLADRRPGAVRSLVRRTTPLMIGAALVGGIWVQTAGVVRERRALAGLPAAETTAPNVLLIILDTVRAASLSAYGYERGTSPNLDRFAVGGVTFERAFATSPWTLPTHATLFTGRYPQEMSADRLTPLDDAQPTLAETLADHGYVTGGFSANLRFATWEMGIERGFARWEDYPTSLAQIARSSWLTRFLAVRVRGWLGHRDRLVRVSARETTDRVLRWVDRSDPGRPFFAFANYFDAHMPYLPPEPYATRFDPRALHAIDQAGGWTDDELRRARAGYDGAIAYVDVEVDRLLTELEARGMLERTVVVISSDHGEHFGEHGLVDHANSLYLPLLHVPLVIRAPGRVPSATTVNEPVSLVDLPRTILDLAELDPGPIPGVSLAATWRPDSVADSPRPMLARVRQAIRMPEWHPASIGDMEAALDARYHYIRNFGDGREELYDYVADPEQMNDLFGLPSSAGIVRELRAQLDRYRSPLTADPPRD